VEVRGGFSAGFGVIIGGKERIAIDADLRRRNGKRIRIVRIAVMRIEAGLNERHVDPFGTGFQAPHGDERATGLFRVVNPGAAVEDIE